MRNIYEVIRQKEAQIQQLQKEVETLKIAAALLSDGPAADIPTAQPKVAPPLAPSMMAPQVAAGQAASAPATRWP